MFTGLIQHTAQVAAKEAAATGLRLTLEATSWEATAELSLVGGESIAVNGCCLTLVEVETIERRLLLRFDVIHQTLRVTTMGRLALGGAVHLERSATPLTLLGGHIVQGHVDGIGRVVETSRSGGECQVRVAPPRELMRYIMPRGSIAVDGVSLTVSQVDDAASTFDVCLIPETLGRTTLGALVKGNEVNLEVDCLAKMVERLQARRG